MAQVDDALPRQMAATIVEATDPELAIPFGSNARGDAEAGPDGDLVVVEAELFGSGGDRGTGETGIRLALAKFHVSKDILFCSPEEADRWRGSRNHVLARALRAGKALHERP